MDVISLSKSARDIAERQVVYSLLTLPSVAHDIISRLTNPDAFSNDLLRRVFRAASIVYRAGDLVCVTSVQRVLERAGHKNARVSEILLECGAVCESGNTPELAEAAASIVAEYGYMDQARRAFKTVTDWQGYLLLADKIYDLDAGIDDDRTRPPAEISGAIIKKQEAIYAGTAEAGYSWGLPRVDDVCRLTPGLHIIAGLKKGAKTHFLLSVLDHNLTPEDPVPCCLFSLEMKDENIFRRLLARHTSVDSHNIHSKYLSRTDFDKLRAESERLQSVPYPLHIDGGRSLNVAEIASRARRWKNRNKVPDGTGLIGVDFLQLIKLERRTGDSEASGIKNVAYSLAGLAKDLDIAVIACAQFRNEAEGQVPHIGFLEGSGAIAQSAEAILIVDLLRRRDRKHVSNGEYEDVNIIVAEQRNGESGCRVKCTVDLKTSRFYEKITKYEQEALTV